MADINKMLKQIRERTKPEEKRFVKKNMAIVDSVFEALKRKGLNASDLARMMDKSPAEISKWLSGSHNLTLLSISKMEVALGEDLIFTPSEAKKQFESVKYVSIKVHSNLNRPNDVVYKNQSTWACRNSTSTKLKVA